MTKTQQIDDLENRLNQASNMVQALQMVLWDVCQMQAHEAIGRQRRDALIGLGDALERQLVTPLPDNSAPLERAV